MALYNNYNSEIQYVVMIHNETYDGISIDVILYGWRTYNIQLSLLSNRLKLI